MTWWEKTFRKSANRLTESERATLNMGVPQIQNGANPGTITFDSFAEAFNITPAFSGAVVNPDTAMLLSVVYACTRLIAGAIASLPLKVYQDSSDPQNPIRIPVPNSLLQKLFNEKPCPGFTAATFWEYIVTSILLRGDGFAYLQFDKRGAPVAAVPVHADNVAIEVSYSGNGRNKTRYLTYWVNDGYDFFPVPEIDMLHFPGFGYGFKLNHLRGMSVVRHAAYQAIGTALAAEETSARFFGGGMTPRIVLEADGRLSDESVVKLRESWQRTYAGKENSSKPLILTEGLKANTLSLSASDAQLLESRRYQVVDLARAFGLPPHMIGEMEKTTAWGTGIAEMRVGFLSDTLQPHITRFEQEINAKAFPLRNLPRQFVEFNVRGLLRADAKSQNEAYRQSVGGSQGPGWVTINEIRALNNDPPLADGDQLYNPVKTNAQGVPANAP